MKKERYIVKALGEKDVKFSYIKNARRYAELVNGIVVDKVDKSIVFDYRVEKVEK